MTVLIGWMLSPMTAEELVSCLLLEAMYHLQEQLYMVIVLKLQTVKSLLAHLGQVDSSITAPWTGLFSKAGCLVSFYYYYIL